MWIAAIAAIGVSVAMLVVRAALGPSVFDRLLAANIIGTNIVVLVAMIGVVKGSSAYIDIALVYALLNFIGTIGFLRFFRYGSFRKAKKFKVSKITKRGG